MVTTCDYIISCAIINDLPAFSTVNQLITLLVMSQKFWMNVITVSSHDIFQLMSLMGLYYSICPAAILNSCRRCPRRRLGFDIPNHPRNHSHSTDACNHTDRRPITDHNQRWTQVYVKQLFYFEEKTAASICGLHSNTLSSALHRLPGRPG